MKLKMTGLYRASRATRVHPVVARCGGYIQVSYSITTGTLMVDGFIDHTRQKRRWLEPDEIAVYFTDRHIPAHKLREATIQAVCFHMGQFQPGR